MLPRLLRRDWILNRRALLVILAIFAAFQVYFVMQAAAPRLYLVFTSVYASFLTITPFTREDKFRSAESSCALPLTRCDIVRARYVGAWILFLASIAAAAAVAALVPGSIVPVSGLLEPAALLLAAAVATLILALLIPFMIRFGIVGVMVVLVVLQILGVVFLLVGIAPSHVGNPGGGGLRGVIAATAGTLAALRESLSPGGFYLTAILVLVLTNWGGYRLALALFRRREF